MRCTVLVDNNTFIDHYYLGEPAFCLYIEDEEEKILLDTGYSDVFIQNAEKMGIDLSQVTKIVISHGHNDHTGGLVHYQQRFGLKGKTVIAHPKTFVPRSCNNLEIGAPLKLEDLLEAEAMLNLSRTQIQVSKHILFLGEIPTAFPFEKRTPIGISLGKQDFVIDDSALCYQNDQGIFIMTGCSHSGICSIMEKARKHSDKKRILGVIGGFHLFEENEQCQRTIKYFKKNKISEIIPCHCVSLKAKIAMAKELTIQECGVGMTLEID